MINDYIQGGIGAIAAARQANTLWKDFSAGARPTFSRNQNAGYAISHRTGRGHTSFANSTGKFHRHREIFTAATRRAVENRFPSTFRRNAYRQQLTSVETFQNPRFQTMSYHNRRRQPSVLDLEWDYVRRNSVKRQRVPRPIRMNRKRTYVGYSARPTTAVGGFAPAQLVNKKQMSKLRFHLDYSFDGLVAVSQKLLNFVGNGCFKPDEDNVTHQPMGWDQMIALYNNFTVLATQIKFHYLNEAATPIYLFLMTNNTPGFELASFGNLEQVGAKRIWISAQGGDNQGIIKGYRKTRTVTGKDIRGEVEWTNTDISNPAQKYWWHFEMNDPFATNLKGHLNVDIKYYGIWSFPSNQLGQS